jgi:hypothetical protein
MIKRFHLAQKRIGRAKKYCKLCSTNHNSINGYHMFVMGLGGQGFIWQESNRSRFMYVPPKSNPYPNENLQSEWGVVGNIENMRREAQGKYKWIDGEKP